MSLSVELNIEYLPEGDDLFELLKKEAQKVGIKFQDSTPVIFYQQAIRPSKDALYDQSKPPTPKRAKLIASSVAVLLAFLETMQPTIVALIETDSAKEITISAAGNKVNIKGDDDLNRAFEILKKLEKSQKENASNKSDSLK